MSWLLKQAEDILNRVDQQTNAALNQHNQRAQPIQNQIEFIPETPSFTSTIPINPSMANDIRTNRNFVASTRRINKTDESDLINYLNSSVPVNNIETSKSSRLQNSNSKVRTSSSSSNSNNISSIIVAHNHEKEPVFNNSNSEQSSIKSSEKVLLSSLQSEIEQLKNIIVQYENDIQSYKRQQLQYQQQIAESDALISNLRTHESDSLQILAVKDSQINQLRSRLNDADESLQTKAHEYNQLTSDYQKLVQNSSNIQAQSYDLIQKRLKQIETELEGTLNENQRLHDDNQQLIEQMKTIEQRFNDQHLQLYEQQQQLKHSKNQINQLEQEMNEYKSKAQRILQTKDKLICKLKDILQCRSSTPINSDQNEIDTNGPIDESTLLDINFIGNSNSSMLSNWTSIQYEELKTENDLFKQELQARESIIHKLRNEIQENDLLNQQNEQQYQENINQLNNQLKDERSRSTVLEQDYNKLKQQLVSSNDDVQKQKQIYQGQLNEREQDIERLRLQITSKTINNRNDEELEKRLQTLTESLIHKQTIIEALQIDKSSLTMKLERLEKRLDDYEQITANNYSQQTIKTTSIAMDDNENYENIRSRLPLLRETPYDVDLTKKVKRAANELDKFGIRLILFLRRYPIVRLAFLFYAIILHLWTFVLLLTHAPSI